MTEIPKEDKKERRDPFDGEYIGNIWGWRFSLLSLALILLMLALMIYRHVTLGVPFNEGMKAEPEETEVPEGANEHQ